MDTDALQAFEVVAHSLDVRVCVDGPRLDPVARAVVGHLASLGCEIERYVISEAAGLCTQQDGLTLIVVPADMSETQLRKLAQEWQACEPAFLGPPLEPMGVASLLGDFHCSYFRSTDHPLETVARLLSRSRGRGSGLRPRVQRGTLDVGKVRLDLDELLLSGPDGQRELTQTEATLFVHLSEHPGTGTEEIARVVLGRRDVNGRGRDLVYRHVANLRAKLKAVGTLTSLVRSRTGYRLCGDGVSFPQRSNR